MSLKMSFRVLKKLLLTIRCFCQEVIEIIQRGVVKKCLKNTFLLFTGVQKKVEVCLEVLEKSLKKLRD